MNYLYYPGCSLTASAREYDLATRAMMTAADTELTEIDGWTCCGASAAAPISHLLALTLSARNLALAETMEPDGQVLVPCSACYLNLKKAHEALKTDATNRERIKEALSVVDLTVDSRIHIRHLLDVLSVDIGAAQLRERVFRSLDELIVAPYYGCQCLRPFVEFDDPERPAAMTPLIEATGAHVFAWEMGARCCGAALVSTQPDTGLKRVVAILKAAKGADLIATVCPMCQMNLDAWQAKASHLAAEDLSITVLYLPQLLGLAMGLTANDIGLDLNLAVMEGFRKKTDL